MVTAAIPIGITGGAERPLIYALTATFRLISTLAILRTPAACSGRRVAKRVCRAKASSAAIFRITGHTFPCTLMAYTLIGFFRGAFGVRATPTARESPGIAVWGTCVIAAKLASGVAGDTSTIGSAIVSAPILP